MTYSEFDRIYICDGCKGSIYPELDYPSDMADDMHTEIVKGARPLHYHQPCWDEIGTGPNPHFHR